MALQQKLNPNAAPFTIFPHSRFTLKPTPYQIISVPVHGGFTYVSAPFYLTNTHFQPAFVPCQKGLYGNMERGVEEVETCSNGFSRKISERKKRNVQRHHAPRFRYNQNQMDNTTSWVEKDKQLDDGNGNGNSKIKLIKKEVNFNGKTTLMIRNIPNQLQRHDLLQVLDKHCLDVNMKERVKSSYDFVYLPMDFRTDGNFGYAFVNFTKSVAASRFFKAFDGYRWDVPINKKTCKIGFAKLQGKAELTNHFKNSIFQCKTREYLPVVLSPPRGSGAVSRIICIGRHRP